MKIGATHIQGVHLITPKVFGDERGAFFESFNDAKFFAALPEYQHLKFVQDNHSISQKGVLRGLHFQSPHPQGKLVRVIKGAIFDVAVDIRPDSITYGQWFGVELNAQTHQQLWIAPGLAHGFLALEDSEVLYKTTDYWYQAADHSLLWRDPTLNITWPTIDTPFILSEKDLNGRLLVDFHPPK
jgi:dTDP-4-dehydrorhamnose 3,5-epimerase